MTPAGLAFSFYRPKDETIVDMGRRLSMTRFMVFTLDGRPFLRQLATGTAGCSLSMPAVMELSALSAGAIEFFGCGYI
jgi:hypothetical protein